MAKSGPRQHPGGTSDDVRNRLIDAALAVAGASGFAQTSARAVAAHAGVAPGVIYYHFGSMDGLLVATHDALTTARLTRIRAAIRDGDPASWLDRLGSVIETELRHADSGAAIELTVGASSSDELAAAVRRNTDRSVETIAELASDLLGDSPLGSIVSAHAIAELAAAAFFGAEVMMQLGRPIDIERLTAPVGALLTVLGPSRTPLHDEI